MKLYFAPTSPYARKARMVVIDKGLEDRVELVPANPYEDSPDLKAANPLGKVPALTRPDGPALFDSPVICAYLDSLEAAPGLIPSEGPARWEVLRREALCDGVLDAALGIVMENRRAEGERSQSWPDRWTLSIGRSLDAVEAEIAGFGGDLTLDQIALGAALGYLDFRLPDLGWRDGRGATAEWYGAFSQRKSMQETAPPAA